MFRNIIINSRMSFLLPIAAISREDHDETTNNHHHHHNRSNNKMPYNGYSEEYLDRLENGSLPVDNKSFNKRKFDNFLDMSEAPSLFSVLESGIFYLSLSFLAKHETEVSKTEKWKETIGQFRVGENCWEKVFQLFEISSSGNAINENNVSFVIFISHLLASCSRQGRLCLVENWTESTFTSRTKRWWDMNCWKDIETLDFGVKINIAKFKSK